MSKPILILDASFIGNIFGPNSNIACGTAILNELLKIYDIKITDRDSTPSIAP